MPKTQGPKQALFEHLAAIARALGHASRLELLDYLAQGERSVETLLDQAERIIASTGYDDISLVALNCADYSGRCRTPWPPLTGSPISTTSFRSNSQGQGASWRN